ncbi:transcriptional repressor NrdR [Candidatus Gottesmanbacteria bacterium]|nr:transcriptional repressor NrdR [Candidatus Gottesmanbacteria bacterium]
MKCPFCQRLETEVIETRDSEDNATTRRRRACIHCGKRFTTYERVEVEPLIVIKKDKRREQFNREKLQRGILKAGEKTTLSLDSINSLVDKVERELRGADTSEIESQKIGRTVARELKKIDKLAYIRFASVFRQFVDLEDLEKELKKIS